MQEIHFKNLKGKAKESVESYTGRRNERIIKLFSKRGFKIHLKGDPQNPMIVLNDGLILSAYAHNFDLYFLNQPNNGEIIEEVKLTWENVDNYPVMNLMKIIRDYEHIQGFRIRLDCGDDELFLVGYNHKDDVKELCPVFGRKDPHVYKTFDYADDLLQKLKKYGYPVTLDQFQLDLDTLIQVQEE
jgi:hypothetical protein